MMASEQCEGSGFAEVPCVYWTWNIEGQSGLRLPSDEGHSQPRWECLSPLYSSQATSRMLPADEPYTCRGCQQPGAHLRKGTRRCTIGHTPSCSRERNMAALHTQCLLCFITDWAPTWPSEPPPPGRLPWSPWARSVPWDLLSRMHSQHLSQL